MVYVAGIVGFIGGFVVGQMLLYYMLRHHKPDELLKDRYLRFVYGLLNWGCAALGSYCSVIMYNQYYGPY